MESSPKASGLVYDDIGLNEVIGVMWRRKWILVLATLVAAAGAFVISHLSPPVFEASTTVLIDLASQARLSEYSAITASDRGVLTYAQLIRTRPVIEEALGRLGLDPGAAEPSNIRVESIQDTQLIEVEVQDTDPMRAADVANTIVEVFEEQNDAFQAGRFAASKESLAAELDKLNEKIAGIETAINDLDPDQVDSRSPEFQRLQTELSQDQASYFSLLSRYEDVRLVEAQLFSTVIQVEPAVPPGTPIRPRVLLNTVVAGFAGLMLALAVIFVVEHLDDSIKAPEDVARATRLPVIGYVADSRKLKADGTRQRLMISEPNSETAESFRSLRTNIELAGAQGTPRSILISSPEPGDGKTTIAAQLAVSMAHGGKRVVLVDANLRRPSLHRYFGMKNELGLSDMLVDDLVPEMVIKHVVHWRLRVITCGKPVDNPAELLGSVIMLRALARLRDQADVAIFDGPPFLVAETFILASKLESVLVVMHHGRTRGGDASQMMMQLDRAQANVVGVVLNRVPARDLALEFETERSGNVDRNRRTGPAQHLQRIRAGR